MPMPLKNMEEAHRLQVEIHTQHLEKSSGSGQDQEERQAGWEKHFFPAPLTYGPSSWSR